MYLTHGETDSLVPPSWGNATHARLASLGVNVAYKSLPRTEHELSVAGLKGLYSWLLERIPV
jgi:predicted esterase